MGIEAAFFGTLGQDAECKTGKGGKPFLRLSVRAGDGDDVQWVSVLAFDPDAVEQADRFERGARVYVEGALRSTEWTGSDGRTRTGLSVMSFYCRLAAIGRNRKRRTKPAPAPVAGEAFYNDAIPFAAEVR